MEIAVEEPFKTTVTYFSKIRKKRHRAVYDQRGLISRKEAQGLLKAAKDFLSYVKRQLKT